MKKATNTQIKALYIQGRTITELSTLFGVTRQTIYAQKARDLKDGSCWDTLALAKAQDISGLKMSEKEFVTTLIKGFEEAFETIKENEAPEQLAILKEYSTMYYKLKAPLKTDCTAVVSTAKSRLLYEISELARTLDDKAVVEFLSVNADTLINKVSQK